MKSRKREKDQVRREETGKKKKTAMKKGNVKKSEKG